MSIGYFSDYLNIYNLGLVGLEGPTPVEATSWDRKSNLKSRYAYSLIEIQLTRWDIRWYHDYALCKKTPDIEGYMQARAQSVIFQTMFDPRTTYHFFYFTYYTQLNKTLTKPVKIDQTWVKK